WAGAEVIASLAYGTRNPTEAQRVAIRRSMHTFVRKHQGYKLDGGWCRTPLHVVGLAGRKPEARERPLAKAPRIPAELSMVSKWRKQLAAAGCIENPTGHL